MFWRVAAIAMTVGLCRVAVASPSTEVVQVGPWRVPIAGVFKEQRDERGLVLTRADGETLVFRFVGGERPTERGEGARRRLAVIGDVERKWLLDSHRGSEVVRRNVQVAQLTAGRTMMSLVTELPGGRHVLRYAVFDAVNQAHIEVTGKGPGMAAAERYDTLVSATRSVGPTTFR
jgi:hypothetical protein